MSDSLLGILKIAFLALLYLFFARVLWAVWSEVRGPRVGRVPAEAGTAAAPRPGIDPAPPAKARRKRGTVTKLVVLQPRERKGATFTVGTEITIGRSPTATISIQDDAYVSTVHARLYQTEDGTVVEDLGSTNGSYLNGGRLVGALSITKGDRLQIGSTVLEAQ
jgi:pSer/pThr/pTyr-binding forkhead associated (FHA) protein